MSGLSNDPVLQVDFLEAGASGPVVLLVHSSVSGARQWRRLMDELKDQFRVRAVNLFGYGKTPPWSSEEHQSLDDQARLVEGALPADADEIYLVGHSFGGSVAMKAAARLKGRVSKLVLLETNPFYLLAQSGRTDAFAEAMEMRKLYQDIRRAWRVGKGGRTIRRLLGRCRIVGTHAARSARSIRASAETEFL
jgi:pimeloyl-ACP methyl ester carboxylesterase